LLDVLIPTPYALHATPHSYKLHREKMYVKGIQSHLMMKSETRVQLITETTTTTTTTKKKNRMPRVLHNVVVRKQHVAPLLLKACT